MRKKSFWLLEIFIWFILLLGLITLGINFGANYLNGRQTYNVTFKDVDGLIVGSPVRLMGIQVGHVTRVDPIDDSVYITFVITNKNVNIPENLNVNIQFTGLAGSKSLEILTSNPHKSGGKYFNVVEPIRISSIMSVLSDITKYELDCSKLALGFLGHGGAEEIKKNIHHSVMVTGNMDNSLENTDKMLRLSTDKIAVKSHNIQKFLSAEVNDVSYINSELLKFPQNDKEAILSVLNQVQDISRPFENGELERYKDKIARNVNTVDKNINKINKNVKDIKANNSDYLDKIYVSLNKFLDGCNRASGFIDVSFKRENIQKTHTQIQMLKNNTKSK